MVNIRSFALHRYAGLLASVWLLVLCVTGIFLDHKKDWAFLWQWQWPAALMSQQSAIESETARYQQVKFGVAGWLVCEPGACQIQNNGHWQNSEFSGAQPLIRQLLTWHQDIYAATDNGIWQSTDGGVTFQPYALTGKNITYLAADAQLFAVERQSLIWQIDANAQATLHPLPQTGTAQLTGQVNLGRLTHDLHFGRGFFGEQIDIWINDISAVLIAVLALSGVYMWLWRKQKHKTRVQLFRFTLSWHRLLIGPLAVLGILYLSITGILLGHSEDLRASFRAVQFARTHLGPVYQLRDWQGQISSLVALPGQLIIGTRHGLFAVDGDNPQALRTLYNGYAWSATRIDDLVYIGGMGAPNGIYDGENFTSVPQSGHMPTDVTAYAGQIIWKNPHGLHTSTGQTFALTLPQHESVPLFYALEHLHSGLIFHSQWKWINDVIALAALLAMGTGLYRLFKWCKVRLRSRHKRRVTH